MSCVSPLTCHRHMLRGQMWRIGQHHRHMYSKSEYPEEDIDNSEFSGLAWVNKTVAKGPNEAGTVFIIMV